jgi:hypothetical protein
MFIPKPDLDFFLTIPDPGVKKAPDPQHWNAGEAEKAGKLHVLKSAWKITICSVI